MKKDAVKTSILFLLTPKNDVAYLEEKSTIRQGLEKMRFHGYMALPVLADDGTFSGIVSEGDFLWYVMAGHTQEDMESEMISAIMTPHRSRSVNIQAKMDDLLNIVVEQNFVPVVDDVGAFIGIITRREIIRYLCENKA